MDYYSAIKQREKEWKFAFGNNMDGPGEYYTSWS